jgi:hypothetical protein
VVAGVTLVPGPVIPSVVVGAADSTAAPPSVVVGAADSTAAPPSVVVGAAESTAALVVGAGRIEDTTDERSETTLAKTESTIGSVEVGALADVVAAAGSAWMGSEVVAAAGVGVMTPLGPNVIVPSEDVVAAPSEVSTVLSTDDVAAAA